MKLPTPEEFEAAMDDYSKQLPQSMAGAVDQSPGMVAWYSSLLDGLSSRRVGTEVWEQYAKALLVLGLNIGIRIGEARK